MNDYIEIWPRIKHIRVDVYDKKKCIARHEFWNDEVTVYDICISKYLDDPIIPLKPVGKRGKLELSSNACYDRRREIARTGRSRFGHITQGDLHIHWYIVKEDR